MYPQASLARMAAEAAPGAEEYLQGLAVLGVTFESGHVLALRHFVRTSSGPGFTAVWMREPSGDWHFFSTNPPSQSCARYMEPEVADQVPIDLRWVDERTLHVSIGAISFRWFVEFEEGLRTRWMSRGISRVPRGALRMPAVSRLVAVVAGKALRAGSLRLHGKVPNGQRFHGLPRQVWTISRSTAWAGSYNFGALVRPQQQSRFGDFWVPAAALAMAGTVEFEPPTEPAIAAAPLAA